MAVADIQRTKILWSGKSEILKLISKKKYDLKSLGLKFDSGLSLLQRIQKLFNSAAIKRLSYGLTPYETCPASNKQRFYFSICFKKVGVPQFALAANTWIENIKKAEAFDPKKDKFFFRSFSTEQQFKELWKAIAEESKGYEVCAGNIFTHGASILNEFGVWANDGRQYNNTGLEFVRDPRNDDKKSPSTLSNDEIAALPILKWNRDIGYLFITGCYNGVSEIRKWCPAGSFSLRQEIATVGLMKSASFSFTMPDYVRIKPGMEKMYLWSYDRDTVHDVATAGSKFASGTGMRVPGKVFIS